MNHGIMIKKTNKPYKKDKDDIPLWLSGVWIWRCHCSGLGFLLWLGFDPYPGNFRMAWGAPPPKKKKKMRKRKFVIKSDPLQSTCSVPGTLLISLPVLRCVGVALRGGPGCRRPRSGLK